jgi:hypothetical protein
VPLRPDRVPGPGRARGAGRRQRGADRVGGVDGGGRGPSTWSLHRRLLALRWTIVGVWAALLTARVIVVSVNPHADVTAFGIAEVAAVTAGVTIIVVAVLHARAAGRRREDDLLAVAVRRVDPTVWVVPARPTAELRETLEATRPEVPLSDRVTWAFGATEASLWELDGRRATRLMVIRWSRVVHVGVEDVLVPGAGRRTAPAVAVHYVRTDDRSAVATFFIRAAPGADRLLARGSRFDDLVARVRRERIVA